MNKEFIVSFSYLVTCPLMPASFRVLTSLGTDWLICNVIDNLDKRDVAELCNTHREFSSHILRILKLLQLWKLIAQRKQLQESAKGQA
mgnify:CR=1 FL=1